MHFAHHAWLAAHHTRYSFPAERPPHLPADLLGATPTCCLTISPLLKPSGSGLYAAATSCHASQVLLPSRFFLFSRGICLCAGRALRRVRRPPSECLHTASLTPHPVVPHLFLGLHPGNACACCRRNASPRLPRAPATSCQTRWLSGKWLLGRSRASSSAMEPCQLTRPSLSCGGFSALLISQPRDSYWGWG